jgi:exopolysaccharide biosynthesis polyprenyl glycosylphosphotransferase
MTKAFGYQLSQEMMLLWCVETAASFSFLYAILSPSLKIFGNGELALLNASIVLALTIGLIAYLGGLYRADTCLETRRLPVKIAVSAALSLLVIWLAGHAFDIQQVRRGSFWPVELLAIWTALAFSTRLVISWAIRREMFVRRVVLIGSDANTARISTAITSGQHRLFRVAAAIPAAEENTISAAFLARERVSDIIVDSDASAKKWAEGLGAEDLASGRGRRARVWRASEFWAHRLGRVDVDGCAGEPGFTSAAPGRLTLAISRLFDLALSTGLLVLTLPLMLLTALAIRMETDGPIFYSQERVGLHGHVFRVHKFRSMRVDAEAKGPVWAAQQDRRVTRVGSFIRRVRIDELPQLLNVMRGEMSFIGPRPERPFFADQIAEQVPLYHERARVKPGLTGWAQVNFPYGASIEDARMKLSYDLYYVQNRSLFLDLIILLSTVRVVLFQEGAR